MKIFLWQWHPMIISYIKSQYPQFNQTFVVYMANMLVCKYFNKELW